MLDERKTGLQFLQDNLDPFLNIKITFADFHKMRKIPFSKEFLVIPEKGLEISFLIFFRIDMGMILGPVLLLKLKV